MHSRNPWTSAAGLAASFLLAGCATAPKVTLSPLNAAMQRGDRAAVEAALAAGEDPGRRDADGWNAFGRAMYHPELYGVVLDHCARVYAKGQNCAGALHAAAEAGRLGVVRTLLARGASAAEADDGSGVAPLDGVLSGIPGHASQETDDDVAIAKLLLDRGADPSKSGTDLPPLYYAITNQRPRITRLLIERGANVNAPGYQTKPLLFWAAWGNQRDTAKALVDKGADVETTIFILQHQAEYDDNNYARFGWLSSKDQAAFSRRQIDFLQRLEQARETAQAAPAAAGVSREELTSIVEAAVKGATRKEAAPAPIVSDVDSPGFSLPPRPDDYALVVGIEKYSNLPQAQFAERDAEAVKDHLLALGLPRRNVVLLTGDQAGYKGMDKFLETWLPRNADKDSRVYFYFSGHGAPDPKTGTAYMLPWDGDANFLENTGYPLDRLYRKLAALKAKEVIVALDSCFSGAGGRSVLPEGARPLVTKLESATVPKGLEVFAAADGSQITSTLAKQGHGTFTYYFLKGLEGAAADPSGAVTAAGLEAYLKPKVQDAAMDQNRQQTPVLRGSADSLVLARFERRR